MSAHRAPRGRAVWPLLASLLFVLAFHALGVTKLRGFALDLGHGRMIGPAHGTFLAVLTCLGAFAAGFFALFVVRALTPERAGRLLAEWEATSERAFLAGASVAALAVALLIHYLVLDGAPLTDDEGCYRFTAELLASGRLSVASFADKLFFDHAFVINDGRYYTQYPLGWPALMVPGVWLGAPYAMNALYSALTVPAVFLVTRRVGSPAWARVAVVLFLASPLIEFGAATGMSHTSCMMALAWLAWLVLRAGDAEVPLWVAPAAAAAFSLAFFIRPATALGMGGPMLAFLAVDLVRRRRFGDIIRFALVGAVGAGLFLLVNLRQTGHPLQLAYQRAQWYARENGYRFSNWKAVPRGKISEFHFGSPLAALGSAAVAFFRLNFALFGWPSSFALAPFAGRSRVARLLYSAVAGHFAVHFFAANAGVDAFGPVHYLELAFPIVVLTALGAARLAAWLPAGRARWVPGAALAGLCVVGLTMYTPVRVTALITMTDATTRPARAVQAAGVTDAVVFLSRPMPLACIQPAGHFVHWWPMNDPDFRGPVVWANHITVARDRALLTHFPGRRGWVMTWAAPCEPRLVALDGPEADRIPDGKTRGSSFEDPPAALGPPVGR